MINIDSFINCKNNMECLFLQDDIIINILNIFNNNETVKLKKNKKLIIKKNILKNPNIQIRKDKIINKVNLILNKMTENNISNLIIEFINTIKLTNENDYNEFIKAIYFKILNEINFVKRYLDYFQLISSIYIKTYNFNNSYLYDLVENKFQMDYTESQNEDFVFLGELEEEDKRINNLLLIREMINYNMLNSDILNELTNIILNQNKHYSDIFYWFKQDNIIIDKGSELYNKINNIIQKEDILVRDKLLLDNLINNQIHTNEVYKEQKLIIKKQVIEEVIIVDSSMIECNNIIDEYLYLEDIDEIEYYLVNKYNNANLKNLFCENLINKYFQISNDEAKKILNLFKLLVKKQVLFKSNLSRGLIMMYNKLTNINTNIKIKLTNFLIFLKNFGITKGLEAIMIKYKIENINF